MPATNRCHCKPGELCDWHDAQAEEHQDRINEAREESDMQAMENATEREMDDRW